ncbi:CBS domain-containing protein [Streptomyces somaliensis]|nr:CBS domain-containing protein [Streptomyces somaliensis]
MGQHTPVRGVSGAPAVREGARAPGAAPAPGDAPVLERAVRDVMRTSLVTVAAGETVLAAWELVERSDARHLPVVLPDGRCVGLLDRAEVAVACAAPAVSLSRRYARDLLRRRRCVVVHEVDTVGRAVAVMDANGCDAVPVVGDDGTLAGLFAAGRGGGAGRPPARGAARSGRAAPVPVPGGARSAAPAGRPGAAGAVTRDGARRRWRDGGRGRTGPRPGPRARRRRTRRRRPGRWRGPRRRA